MIRKVAATKVTSAHMPRMAVELHTTGEVQNTQAKAYQGNRSTQEVRFAAGQW